MLSRNIPLSKAPSAPASLDNTELQARLKDMLEVVAILGRIAEGFASFIRHCLVPVCSDNPDVRIVLIDRFSQNQASNPPWAWVPSSNNAQPLQQDPTSFNASFT